MGNPLTTIGFDADDTLWHNERFFALTQVKFAELLADYTDRDSLMDRLRDMLAHPVELLPDVRETLETLQDDYRLVLVTKGDLLDQERKLAESGLRDMFTAIEIVSDKTPQTYQRIFDTHGDGPARGMMIGNSMKSDVVPMIHAGGHGVYIPHGVTWALEHAPAPSDSPRFHQITRLSEVAELLP